ncbi:MAG: hypothetical protein R3F25_04895 [Gammaproteobacteria bacterium]
MRNFKINKPYFRFTFIDENYELPEILTYVYLGQNLDSGDERLWYFQDVQSYANGVIYQGNNELLNRDKKTDILPELLVLEEKQLNTFCAIDELITKLSNFKLGIKLDQWGKYDNKK